MALSMGASMGPGMDVRLRSGRREQGQRGQQQTRHQPPDRQHPAKGASTPRHRRFPFLHRHHTAQSPPSSGGKVKR
ncbi:hypothetical protein FBZ84_11612 [Azospirillum baldaniorum]|nr:hypothetical protein FBZ84_11612 [Azospirillum baldaniorum]